MLLQFCGMSDGRVLRIADNRSLSAPQSRTINDWFIASTRKVARFVD